MAEVQFSCESQNFTGSCIVAASSFPSNWPQPFDAHVNAGYSLDNEIDHTHIEYEWDIYFQIKGYDSYGGYPYLRVCLGGLNSQPDIAGLAFGIGGLVLTTGSIHGVHKVRVDYGAWDEYPITSTSDFPDQMPSWYWTDGEIHITECNIPIIFDAVPDDTEEITWSDYMWYRGNSESDHNMIAYSPKEAIGYEILTSSKFPYIYNYVETEPDGEEFQITNTWFHGTWSDYGPSNVSDPHVLGVRGKLVSGSKIAFYDIPGISDGKLKLGIKLNGEVIACQYLNESGIWTDTSAFPYTFLYRKRVDELGTFDYALTDISSPFPIFDSEYKANLYMQGVLDISEASNWDRISQFYPATNPTETEETITTMGEAGNRAIFTQYYIVPLSVLYEIANSLYDTDPNGVWEDIKKGLEMYGQNPIEAVSNLSFYPLDMSAVLPSAPQSYIYFGGYKLNLTAGSVERVANPNGYKTLGSMTIKRSFNSWRDFEPYTKLFVYLPYIGTYQLELARYYGKLTEIRYYFDISTNTIVCCLMADNKLTDYWTGQMGVNMPITMTNFALFAQTQIQTLIGGVTGGINTGANIAGMGKAAASTLGAASMGVGAGLMIDAQIAKTAYGVTQNNINNFNKTKGGSSSMLNEFLPQYPYFIFETQEDCAPENYGALFGYPSMKAGKINNFSGFLKVQSVDLKVSGATESEREKILALLKSGIYI